MAMAAATMFLHCCNPLKKWIHVKRKALRSFNETIPSLLCKQKRDTKKKSKFVPLKKIEWKI
jgi:hypothetical protein